MSFGCETTSTGRAISIRSTGEIYIAGSVTYCGGGCGAGPSFAVARLTSDGSLDTRFDADGRLTTTFSGYDSDQINAVAITADDKFLAAGSVTPSCSPSNFALARYNSPSGLEERRFVEHDANYNITSISDVYGVVSERYEYTPYGEQTVLNATTWATMTTSYAWVYGFQGGRSDTGGNKGVKAYFYFPRNKR